MEPYNGADTASLFQIRGLGDTAKNPSFFKSTLFPDLYKVSYEQLHLNYGWSHGQQFNWKGEQLSEFDDDQKDQLLLAAGWSATNPERCHEIAIEFLRHIEVYPGSRLVTEISSDFPSHSGQTFSGPTVLPSDSDESFLVAIWVQSKKDKDSWCRDCYKFGLEGKFQGYHRCDLVWGR
eukprot:TRINITY_DN9095_c0_g1_i1.p1 TRINITY_DN9095_c0_g1~~TRINITY_DN9095_c0_g1_i1.p1  ORF type:complete len:178 (-),score=25.83 TRINITY_DN9095_c0_g1_i1:114-647(-)